MVKCAIFGCGQIAGGYDTPEGTSVRTHAKAFVDNDECELVGVYDIELQKAEMFAKTWNVSFVADSPKNLLTKCNPEVISICTPTNTHEELFSLACNSDVKTIWLEKPAAASISAVEGMIRNAETRQKSVWLNYYRRYDSGFKRVKESLPELGELYNVRAIYTKGLRHNGSHMLDLITWLFGDITVKEITSILKDKEYPTLSAKLTANSLPIDLVGLDYKKYEMFEVDILGSLGRIRIIDGGQQILFEKVIESKYYAGYKNLGSEEIHKGSYSKFMRQGLAMGLNSEPMPSLEDELKIQKNLYKISQLAGIAL